MKLLKEDINTLDMMGIYMVPVVNEEMLEKYLQKRLPRRMQDFHLDYVEVIKESEDSGYASYWEGVITVVYVNRDGGTIEFNIPLLIEPDNVISSINSFIVTDDGDESKSLQIVSPFASKDMNQVMDRWMEAIKINEFLRG